MNNLAAELESDLRDTVNLCRKWLVNFNVGKTQFVLFDQSDNCGATDVKMDGSVLERKSSFEMVGFSFCAKLDWVSYVICIAKKGNWSFDLFYKVSFS